MTFFEKSEEIRFLLKIENNGVLRSLKVFDFLFFQDAENFQLGVIGCSVWDL